MRKILTKMAVSSAIALTCITAAASAGGADLQLVWVDSLKVQSQVTTGQTTNKVYTNSPVPERVFHIDTIEFRERLRAGSDRTASSFTEYKYKYRVVPKTIAGSTDNVGGHHNPSHV